MGIDIETGMGIDMKMKTDIEMKIERNDQQTPEVRQREVVVIGGGLTGLATAFYALERHKDVEVVECSHRTGGQIHSFHEQGFTFESGPNTGVISHPEVAELFEALDPDCLLETARESSKKRLIWKGHRFHALPAGLMGAVTTPLFSWYDKFRILGEPFRAKGTDPNESVGALARRRLGKSYLNYAVDPFLSGVYAGDPLKLVTRYALPKLYQLEQAHGSFIKGALAKAKAPKSERDKRATKKVFSMKGGLESLVQALAHRIGDERITLNAQQIIVSPDEKGWKVSYNATDGVMHTIRCQKVITTVGAYALPDLLPFVSKEEMQHISNLHYAPVVQVAVGFRSTDGIDYPAFGGLIPSCEQKKLLGILFPSACFTDRAPEGGALHACFLGGVRHPEIVKMSDEEIRSLIEEGMTDLLKYHPKKRPDFIRIFRHERAIPQYEANSGRRLEAIQNIQKDYPGLLLGGNIRDGIGMADRIKQGVNLSLEL